MNSVEKDTLPISWVLETLGTVVELENGDRGKNYPSKKTLVSEGVPFINTGHLEGNKISKSKITYITEEHFERLGSGKIKVNDILFCLRGSLGKFALNESIRPLKSELGDLLLEFNYLSTPGKLIQYQSKFFEKNLIKIDIMKIKKITEKNSHIKVSDFIQKTNNE